jgi:hypothetical protein
MDADSVKQVQVTLSNDAEAAALTGGKRPRRRGTRKQRGGAAEVEAGRVSDIGGSLSPQEAAVAEGPEARVMKLDTPAGNPTGIEAPVSGEGRGAPLIGGGGGAGGVVRPTEPISPLAVASSITPPTTTMPVLASTTVGGGNNAPVIIGGKRGNPIVSTVGGAKILPTKRRLTGAPAAQTLRKPKFKIGGGGAETSPNPGIENMPSGEVPENWVPKIGGAAKQTRRFKARKIKLTVKSSRATKEIRHKVKAKVRAMSVTEVRKLLLSKGVIKASAAEKLPEDMLRNMLRDYMMLHNAE